MSLRVATALTALAEIYQRNLSQQMLEVYISILAKVDEEIIIKSLMELAKSSKYFPKPAEVLEQARILVREQQLRTPALMEGPEPNEQDRADIQQLINDTKEGLGWD